MATDKFKALTHFIVHECGDNPGRLGATRLNKALWNADVTAFKTTGKSITGDGYMKRQNGPVPKHILATIKSLKDDGSIIVQEPLYQYDPRKYISLTKPKDSALTDEEKDIARSAVNLVCGMSTTTVSELTHDIIWESAAMGEEIPLYATLASRQGEITGAVLDWANSSIVSRSAA